MLRVLEDEGKGVVEFLAGAEPYKLAGAAVDFGFEMLLKMGACPRIYSTAAPYVLDQCRV